MKSRQQMSVDISNQGDMQLKALTATGLKNGDLFSDDVSMHDNYHLQLEDDGEEKNEIRSTTIKDVSPENEDAILNKFVSSEEETVCNGISEEMDENCLNDSNEELVELNVNGDKKTENSGNDKEEEKEKQKTCPTQEEQKQKSDATIQEEKEKVNADLLEDQIMDTEHLLEIVDKEQEDGEYTNDKDSCSSNSETSPDKTEDNEAEREKDEEGEDEKNEEDEEKEKDEEEESEKTEVDCGTNEKEDDDCMDIEESSPYNGDFDSELDKEYQKIVNEKDDNVVKQITEDNSNEKDISKETKENGLMKDVTKMEESKTTVEKTDANVVDDCESTIKSIKRLSDSDEMPHEFKKVKLVKEETVQPKNNCISEYMKKNAIQRIAKEDLEQICLMKMCEAICYKSEIGELRHQLGVQEQMVDMWRKEAVQLTKQVRDLEIVNKRLLHEVRLKNERDKPLIPVRITRSVGLQVRCDGNFMANGLQSQKRRFNKPPTTNNLSTKSNNRVTPSKQSILKTVTNKVATTPITKAIVTTTPKTKTLSTKSPSSLLSKALQNSAVQAAAANSSSLSTNHLNVNNSSSQSHTLTPTNSLSTSNVHKSLPNLSPKPTPKPTETKTVIDLTDEDDKKPIIPLVSTPSMTTGNNTPSGVHIISSAVKNGTVVSTSSVTNPPRIMYVYNNNIHQNLISTDSSKIGSQKVMVKVNSNIIAPTNGTSHVIATVASSLAVNNVTRTSQAQSLRMSNPTVRTVPSKVLKHPAPLPLPPMIQISSLARKPIPPKPHLSIRRSSGGIVLSWKMPYNLDNFEAIASYQLYAYQETTSPPSSDMWRKVGDVKALALPMACTLTQFADGNKYHFAVRAVDVQKRMGPFSDPEQILL
ncbi:hypothetical protein FQA39_LY07770 [Lamprigera yunnana]|nr:hypothetical protein FQA39_LY07770 [Lamprigera yunnana]